MPLPKFIESGSTSVGRVGIDIPIGRYSALAIVVFGTAEDAQAIDPASVCTVRLEREGRQLQKESARFYHDLQDLKGGAPVREIESATPGVPQRFGFAVPLAFPGTGNTLDVTSKEEADLYLEWDSNLETVFGAGGAQYEVYGIREPGVMESYELLVREQDKQSTRAGRLEDTINGMNTGGLYIYDDGDILGQLQVEVDGDTIVDNIPFDFLQDLTNLENRVENKRIALKETLLVKTGNLTEALNGNMEVSYTFTGSGTLEVTALQISRENTNAEASRARVQRFLRAKGVQR